MTNDNKTLADVQPGGRVRLGDALLPCPFCGNDAEFVPYKNNGLTLKCKSMGCIQRHQRTLRYGIDWLRTSMTEHWNARALSAQPSPGGQGDALKALDDLAAFCSDDTATVDRHVSVIRAALAARQPVGVTFPWENFPAYLIDKCEGDTISEEGLQQALAEMAKDEGYCIAARQPVGDEERAEIYRNGWEAGNAAQAVDLEQFRPAVCAMGLYAEEPEEVDEAKRLLALIDSQAVGK